MTGYGSPWGGQSSDRGGVSELPRGNVGCDGVGIAHKTPIPDRGEDVVAGREGSDGDTREQSPGVKPDVDGVAAGGELYRSGVAPMVADERREAQNKTL